MILSSHAAAVTRGDVAGYNDATMTDAVLVRAALDGDGGAVGNHRERGLGGGGLGEPRV